MKTPKRRRYLVNGFQYRLLGFDLAYCLVLLTAIGLVVFAPLVTRMNDGSLGPAEKNEVARQLLALHGRAWPVLLIVLVFFAVHSIVVSHRIAGPIYRFRQIFEGLLAGDLTANARLRRRDYLKDEADVLNEAIDRLRSRVNGVFDSGNALRSKIERLGTALDGSAVTELQALEEELRVEAERLMARVEWFHVGARAQGDHDRELEQVPAPLPDSRRSSAHEERV